jgi:protein ImuA
MAQGHADKIGHADRSDDADRIGHSDRIETLRRALARLDPSVCAAPAWRVAERPPEAGRTCATHPALTPLLATGKLFGGLHEIVAAGPADGSAALGFALGIMAVCARRRPAAGLVLVFEDFGALETGVPYGPGLVCAGFDPAKLLLVRTPGPRETLQAMETALRCTAVAGVLGESLITPRLYDLATSRRLLLAARAGGAAGLFVPLAFAGQGARLSSAATARFEVARRRSAPLAFGNALPMPGPPAFDIRPLKMPGSLNEAAARARERPEAIGTGVSGGEAVHAFSFDPFPLSSDGSRATAGGGPPVARRA